MPGERLTLRSTSEIGRFPGTAPPTRVELTIQKLGEKKQEEGGCRRWFRKICPCCCKRQNSTSYDVTEKIEYTKEPTPEPIKPNPENGETKEIEGKLAMEKIKKSKITLTLRTVVCILNMSNNISTDKVNTQLLVLLEVKLSVCSMDLWSSKTGPNRVEHHTDLYHGDDLIIRRGQTFQMEMELNRTFNADTDKMHLELKTGNTLMNAHTEMLSLFFLSDNSGHTIKQNTFLNVHWMYNFDIILQYLHKYC